MPEVYHAEGKKAVELGAGLGVPSVALAKTFDIDVIAADVESQARALMTSNALAGHASEKTADLDHWNMTAVTEFRSMHQPGFSIILGSALEALFDVTTSNPNHQLRQILDVLLQNDSRSLVFLVHTAHSLLGPPNGKF